MTEKKYAKRFLLGLFSTVFLLLGNAWASTADIDVVNNQVNLKVNLKVLYKDFDYTETSTAQSGGQFTVLDTERGVMPGFMFSVALSKDLFFNKTT